MGLQKRMSLTWVPVLYGSLATMMSPGSSLSTPYSSITLRTESVMVPVKSMMLLLIAGVTHPACAGEVKVAAKS